MVIHLSHDTQIQIAKILLTLLALTGRMVNELAHLFLIHAGRWIFEFIFVELNNSCRYLCSLVLLWNLFYSVVIFFLFIIDVKK